MRDAIWEVGHKYRNVLDERTDAQCVHRVADIDRNRHALFDIECRIVPTIQATVLDVVMDQKRVVEKLDWADGSACSINPPNARYVAGRRP